VGVGVARGREDGAALDTGLQALFLQREALQFGEAIAVGGALGFLSRQWWFGSVAKGGGEGERA
jgi:hypothetical protein